MRTGAIRLGENTDNRNVNRPLSPDLVHKLIPIHARHVQVREDKVDLGFQINLPGFKTIDCRYRHAAFLGEHQAKMV